MRKLALVLTMLPITVVITVISGAYADQAAPDRTYFYRGGLFTQLADCQAVLPAQQKLFQEQTGLTPVAASCIPGRESDPQHPSFTPVIDAVGTPNKHLYPVDTSMKLGMQNSPQAMALLHSLIQKSETIALETSDEVLYYGSEPLEISSIDVSWFNTASDCASQLDTLRAAYHQGGVSTMLGDCFLDEVSNSTRLVAAWTGDDTTVAQDHAFTSPVYSTFSACMDAKDGYVTAKKAALPKGKHIFGAICKTHENENAANDGYDIDLFWDNF
jgi:hypothetical protein